MSDDHAKSVSSFADAKGYISGRALRALMRPDYSGR